ncbi:hypothetical protein GQ600_18228 [Phytophthora cactorum]|nr:hypothetical protein GQ600_18228 [Phytophthora cactorum]
MNNQPSKRKRTDTSPVKTPAAPLPDAETELLRALEEEILKEEEKNKHDKNKKFPLEEEETTTTTNQTTSNTPNDRERPLKRIIYEGGAFLSSSLSQPHNARTLSRS